LFCVSDFVKKRLYWVDAKMHMIGSSDLQGNNQRTILSSQRELRHPFSIAVFEDKVYWSDWEHEAIKSVNKFTGEKSQSHAIHLFGPMDVHVLHPLKQPKGRNFKQIASPLLTPFFRLDPLFMLDLTITCLREHSLVIIRRILFC
jgi:hypothetical protein